MRPLTIKMIETGKQHLFVVPHSCTFLNALFGFFSIINALNNEIVIAGYCILAAVCMDVLDGYLARKLKCSSGFGTELDSLCDVVSFCLVPAVLLYVWRLHTWGMSGGVLLGLYLCAGLFRLARFNTITPQPSHFSGLPTTATAFFFADFIICLAPLARTPLAFLQHNVALCILIVLFGILMVMPVPFFSIKTHRRITKRIVIEYVAAIITFIGMCVLLGYPFLFLIVLGYIALNITTYAISFIKKKHCASLKF